MKRARYLIDKNRWSSQQIAVQARVKISFLKESVILNYEVEEPAILAKNSVCNSPVYQDSCVEFFVSFNKKKYYNFECNCIGTLLGQYGESRDNRIFIDANILSEISVSSSLGSKPFSLKTGVFSWNVELNIPKKVFCFSDVDDLSTVEMFGNFYKCGDNLPKKHYLSAFEVKTENPDFHRPEFFVKLTE